MINHFWVLLSIWWMPNNKKSRANRRVYPPKRHEYWKSTGAYRASPIRVILSFIFDLTTTPAFSSGTASCKRKNE
jgi:hypothetical protein